MQGEIPRRYAVIPDVGAVVDEGFYGGYVGFHDNAADKGFASTYDSPGWKRAQANRAGGMPRTRAPLIEAQAYVVQTSDPSSAAYQNGDRVFHQKFGYGRVTNVEDNKLTVEFDKAGSKRVIDNFVARA